MLASDALHFYAEAERDRPFAIVADLPAMYRAYDLLNELAGQPGTHLVAGHDPLVSERFAAAPGGPRRGRSRRAPLTGRPGPAPGTRVARSSDYSSVTVTSDPYGSRS